MSWFVAAGVADGLLAFGVRPAGAVGDQLAVVAHEQSADDVPDGVELGVARLDQSGADVVPEPEIAAGGVGVPGARLGAAGLVVGGRVAELLIIDAGSGEVRLLAGRGRVAFPDVFVDEVEHERGVDDPDPGSEVLPAVVDVGVAAVAGAVADLAGDADLQRPRLRAGASVSSSRSRRPGSQPRIAAIWLCSWVSRCSRACAICSAASSIAPSSIRTA